MQDMILHGIGDFVQRYLHNAGYLLVAVAALGWVLGSLKGVIASLFNAGLRLGDRAAAQAARKPKGAMIGIGLVGLCFASLWAWHEWSAPKIVEREVIVEKPIAVPVVDHENAAEAESARRDAEARAINAEAQAHVAQQELEAKRQEAAVLAAKVDAAKPAEGDKERIARLTEEMDDGHFDGTQREAKKMKGDYRRFGRVHHKRLAYEGTQITTETVTYYHRRCKICEHNYSLKTEIDGIYERMARENYALLQERRRQWAVHEQARMVAQEEEDRPYVDEEGEDMGFTYHDNDMITQYWKLQDGRIKEAYGPWDGPPTKVEIHAVGWKIPGEGNLNE